MTDPLAAAIAVAMRELADDNDYIYRPPTYWTDRAAKLLAHPSVATVLVPTLDVSRLQFVQRVKVESGGPDCWEAVSTDNPARRAIAATLPSAISLLGAVDDCQHPDWRLDHTGLIDPGIPLDGPFGARRLTSICTDCGSPVRVGGGAMDYGESRETLTTGEVLERDRIEQRARLEDALDALTSEPFASPHIWRSKARSGAVAVRRALAATPTASPTDTVHDDWCDGSGSSAGGVCCRSAASPTATGERE